MSNDNRQRNLISTDASRGREQKVAPGLWVTRRSFFACCSAGIAATSFVAASKAFTDEPENSFAAFLESANAMAERLVRDKSREGQNRYLHTLAADAAGLRDVPPPDNWRDSNQSDGPGTFIGFNPGGIEFTVLQWRMDPSTRILPHAHTYGNVVTVGLEGLVRIRNFEVVGARDYRSDADFVVRNTVDQLLTPGSTNLVSLERDYIHGFDAGDEGGRGLDITTRLQVKPDFGVPYLFLKEPIHDVGPDRHFVARWNRV